MKHITLSILLLCVTVLSTAQIRKEYNHVIASPTPAELGRFASFPVSLATGTINISVPVYTLECGSLSLPITLAYNASGIRVDQIASWVGLGWNLLAGGSISVNVVGNSDLERKRVDIKDFSVLQTKDYPKQDELYTLVYSDLNTTYGAYDSQPDIFSFNFNGYTGQFLLDKDLNAHIVNDMQRLKVTVNKNSKSISIVDNKGVIYSFSEYETTTNKIFTQYISGNSLISSGRDPVSKTATTAYFLTKITSPDREDIITFNYADETVKYTTEVVAKLLDYGNNNWDGSKPGSLINPDPATYSEVTSKTKRLASISTSKGDVITFNSNLSRADLNGGYALTDIILKRGSTPVVSWKLDYAYFNANPTSPTNSYLNKRLELNSITCQQSNESYQFYYYGHANMPYRTAYGGHDMWGYFNGPGGNVTNVLNMFPYVNNQKIKRPTEYRPGDPIQEWNPSGQSTTIFNFTNGHSQEVDPTYSNVYSLQRIKYPTGGYTEFIYQSNTYSFCKYSPGSEHDWGGLRIYKVISYNDIYQPVHTKTYTYVANINHGSSGCVNAVPQMCRFKVGITPQGYRRLFPELSSVPYNQLYSFNGDYLIYKQVQERDENGYIDHYYTSFYEYYNRFYSLLLYMQFLNTAQSPLGYSSYSPSLDFNKENDGQHYARGLEFNRNYYNTDGKFMKNISYDYSFTETARIFGMEAIRGPSPMENGDYDVNIYFYPVGRALLDSVSEMHDQVSSSIKYKYNDKCLVTQETYTDSNGENTVIATRYPSDINSGVYASMVNKGMWDYPIEETTTKARNVSSVLNTYRSDGTGYYPDKIYTLNQVGTLSPFTGTVNPAYREKVFFERYNKGNLLQVTTNDGMSTSYIWGYKGKYPIAEIKNVTYYTLEHVIPGTQTYLDELFMSDSPSMGNVNSLRRSFPATHIRTFTYHPTFGISSECDAKGLYLYYEYTADGKLKGCYKMVNGQKQYLKSYEYNFRH